MRWLLLLVLVGCSTWRPTYLTSTVPASGDKPTRTFIVTEGTAYELDVTARDAWNVYGKARRAWSTLPGTVLGIHVTDEELEKSESPDDTAERFGWQEIAQPDGNIAIPVQGIRHVRAYKVSENRVLGIVGGTISGVVSLFLAGVIIVGTLGGGPSGRPLRVKGTSHVAPVTARGDWSQPLANARVTDDRVRRELARIWTEEAQAEHASIAAFAKVSLELIALGSPPSLVGRVHHAALQEIEHARLCFGVASAYAGETIGPGTLPQACAGEAASIERLAEEAIVDGWLGEGLAADLAQIGFELCGDAEVACVLRTQAHDEASHAQLSRDIVQWCLERSGEALRERLVTAVVEAPAPVRAHLPEFGRIGGEVAELRFEALRTQILKDLRPRRGKSAEQLGAQVGT